MPQYILSMENITKIYPNGFRANTDITLRCTKGTVHALLGENGAGKTTLMKILFGFLAPDKGKIMLKGEKIVFKDSFDAIQHGVGMVHQHFMLVDELSIAENLVLGKEPTKRGFFDNALAVEKTAEIAKKYNFDINPTALVGDCSVAVKQKVEILKALYHGAEILILDEPTAVLTPQEINLLFIELKKLRDAGHTIVFISHKLNEVKEICDAFTILRKGKVVGSGKIEDYTEQELSNLMVGREVEKVSSEYKSFENAKTIISVENLNYTSSQGKRILNNVSLKLKEGQILGVSGVEGNGQKELSEIITGIKPLRHGDITVSGESIKGKSIREIRSMGVAHISEDRMTYGSAANISVQNNIIADRYFKAKYSKGVFLNTTAIKKDVSKLIKEFDVVCPSAETPSGMLSGGNIQKMIAAREFTSDSKAIVANQPTRGIDVGSSMFIHEQLVKNARGNNVGVLLISADLSELIRLSDSILVMFSGEITAYFDDASNITEAQLGEYMLGVKKMTKAEIERGMKIESN